MHIIHHERHEKFGHTCTSFSHNCVSKRQLRSYTACISLTISHEDRYKKEIIRCKHYRYHQKVLLVRTLSEVHFAALEDRVLSGLNVE